VAKGFGGVGRGISLQERGPDGSERRKGLVGYGSVGLVVCTVLGTYRVNFMLCLSWAMRLNRLSAWSSEVSDGASIHTGIVGK